jgi:hypothetical protein
MDSKQTSILAQIETLTHEIEEADKQQKVSQLLNDELPKVKEQLTHLESEKVSLLNPITKPAVDQTQVHRKEIQDELD